MRSLAVLLSLTALARAQEGVPGRWQRPMPVDLAAAGIGAVAAPGGGPERIAALDIPAAGAAGERVRLPFAVPVHEVAVARFADGRHVVLAGGVRDGLTIYVVDPRTRTIDPHPTEGGRRLPSTFANGLGSWPLDGGDGLSVFAFERDERVHFKAVCGRDPVASATLPLDCAGFEADFDERTREVVVVFRGPDGAEIGRLPFLHPIVPIATVVEPADGAGVVDFGRVEVGATVTRRVELRNDGRLALTGELSVDGPVAVEPAGPAVELAPGARLGLVLRWAPRTAGPLTGSVRLASAVRTGSTTLELRGAAEPAPPPQPDAPAPDPDPSTTAVATDGEGLPVPPAPALPELPALRAPERIGVDARWVSRDSVWLRIVLDREDAGTGQVAIRCGRATAPTLSPVRADGVAETRIAARALDELEVAPVRGAVVGAFAPVGAVPPGFRVAGDWLELHAPADTDVLLLEVVVAPDSSTPTRVLRSWRARTGADGVGRLQTASFVGDGDAAVHVVLAVPDSRGDVATSSPFEIAVSTPGSRRDRPN